MASTRLTDPPAGQIKIMQSKKKFLLILSGATICVSRR